MTEYTVVGYYEDNGQPFADFQEADSPEEAAAGSLDASDEGDLIVMCVFEGKHTDKLRQSRGDRGYSRVNMLELFEEEEDVDCVRADSDHDDGGSGADAGNPERFPRSSAAE